MSTSIMTKPVLSQDFTIDDIHKLREYNYEITKDLSVNELIEYYKNKADIITKKYNIA